MSFINFNPTASNGAQNALAMGLQLGQQAAEGANRRGLNNALANFDPSNPDSIREVTRFNPQVGLQLQQQAQQQAQAQQQQQQQQMTTFRRLLDKAGEGPEGYAQALGAAQQLGIDVSNIPQQFNPEWVAQQKFILDALSDPQTLTSIQRDVQSLDIDPETPEGRAAVSELILFKYAKPTTDEFGRPAVSLPSLSLPGGATTGINPAANAQAPQILPQSARPQGKTDAQLIEDARAAIDAGVNVDTVFRQLKAWGVNP